MNNSNTRPAISVIVPVYKVEPYIHQCVDSILTQSFTDFELILVDDGSPDNCGAICDEYAKKDNRVVVIHQENQGLSAARNAALEIFKGDYIAFIDSDDFISGDYLEVLYTALIKTDADFSMCGFLWNEEESPDAAKAYVCTDHELELSGQELSIMRYRNKIDVAVRAKLYRKHLFDTIRFPVGKVYEDQAVVPYIFYSAQKACLLSSCHYYYRIRKTSISHSTFSVNRFDNIIHMNIFIEFLKQHNETELMKLAKKHRADTLALYTIQAKRNGITNIPDGCSMSEVRAFSILRRNVSNDLFIWFLNSLHPWLVRPYAYFRKIESLVTGKPLMGENKNNS